jgi:hypothetical protein
MQTRGTIVVVDAQHQLQRRVREIVEPYDLDTTWVSSVHATYRHIALRGAPDLLLVSLDFASVGWQLLETIQRDIETPIGSIAFATARAEILKAHARACVGYPILALPIRESHLLDLVRPASMRPPLASCVRELCGPEARLAIAG